MKTIFEEKGFSYHNTGGGIYVYHRSIKKANVMLTAADDAGIDRYYWGPLAVGVYDEEDNEVFYLDRLEPRAALNLIDAVDFIIEQATGDKP